MRTTKKLLALLTEFFPPPEGQHHSITMSTLDGLRINLKIGEHQMKFIIMDSELDLSAADLALFVIYEKKQFKKDVALAQAMNTELALSRQAWRGTK